jgi:hypothetical protein
VNPADLARAGKILLDIGNSAHRLHGILVGEAPEFEPAWRELVLDAYRMSASASLVPDDLTDLAERIERAIGIGLGSLADLVLERESRGEMERVNDELEELRCRLGFNAARLRNLGQESGVDLDHLRAMVARLENTFVEENVPAEAQRCRALLAAGEVDCFGVCNLVHELSHKKWAPGLALRLGHELPAMALVLKPFIVSYHRGTA